MAATEDGNKPMDRAMDKRSRAEMLLSEDLRQAWESEQDEIKQKIILQDTEDWQILRETEANESKLRYIGGVDISFVKGDDVAACASLVIVNYPDLEVVYEDCKLVELTAPYAPGFLAFREVPFLVDCFERLRVTKPEFMPQVIMVDGNGILHPKGCGLASHLGVLLDIPTVGVAKKLFQVDGLEKNETHTDKIKSLQAGGDTFPLIGDSGTVLGMALRSCSSTTNPVYISIGHRISLNTAVKLVYRCCKHRVPEPVRQADLRSREYLRQRFPQEPPQQKSASKS